MQFLVDLYKNGYAPKDSVNWGFNEIVAGFYSGTCAMLDQDPDALIAIAERMKPEDYGVAPMPKGPSGKAFPTIGYAGWAMFSDSEHKDVAWKLIATLVGQGRQHRLEQAHRRAARSTSRRRSDPFYADRSSRAGSRSSTDPDVHADGRCRPTSRSSPSSRTRWSIKTSQEALLGERTPEDLAKEWADYLTEAQQKFLAAQ